MLHWFQTLWRCLQGHVQNYCYRFFPKKLIWSYLLWKVWFVPELFHWRTCIFIISQVSIWRINVYRYILNINNRNTIFYLQNYFSKINRYAFLPLLPSYFFSYLYIYFFKTQNFSWSFIDLLPKYIYEGTTLSTFLIGFLWKNKHTALKKVRYRLCPEILPTPTLFL